MFTKTLMFAAGLSSLMLAAPNAFAAEATSASRGVHYADLDLSTAEGQAALDGRLRRAAEQVCDLNAGQQPLAQTMAARRCYTKALNGARQNFAAVMTRKSLSR